MKLSQKTIGYIRKVVNLTTKLGLDVLIIDKNGIRARNTESYIYLMLGENFDWLEVDSICVNKMFDLSNRIKFIEEVCATNNSQYSIAIPSVKELDSGDKIAVKLQVNGHRTAIEVGCANAAKHKLPHAVTDEKLVSFIVDETSASVISGMGRVVRNQKNTVNIRGVNGSILLEGADNEGDNAVHLISKEPDFNAEEETFSFSYDHRKLPPLITKGQLTEFTITRNGFLLVEMDGLIATIFPEN